MMIRVVAKPPCLPPAPATAAAGLDSAAGGGGMRGQHHHDPTVGLSEYCVIACCRFLASVEWRRATTPSTQRTGQGNQGLTKTTIRYYNYINMLSD